MPKQKFIAAVALVSLMTSASSSDAQTTTPSAPARKGPSVLDIENRRVVGSERLPTNAGPTVQALIIGGGLGGVAAAEALARQGISSIIVEPTRALGGQLTSQVVPVPDENRFIEQESGPSTDSWRALRERVRAHYANVPGVKTGAAKNVGQCWVSRVSGTPDVWQTAIQQRIEEAKRGFGLREVYLRHQIRSVTRLANGNVNYADIVDLDTGKVTRIGARFLIDASEDGATLDLAGCSTVIGQEGKAEYNEAHAPDEARPDWVQSFTYCFALRYDPNGPKTVIEKPEEYDYFKSLGEYTLDYVYSERGTVTYKMFTKAEGAGGPFWTYRRLLASSSFTGRPPSPSGDIALINWRGNDFHEETYLGKPLAEQARILSRGKAFAQGFLHWLQTECPRDDGQGVGYPEMQLVGPDEMPGVAADGFAQHPYVRESRRLKAKFMLNENHLVAPPGDATAKWGEAFGDTVGCALYAIDIHPTKGEPPLLVVPLPYHLPLGSFLTESGPTNVLPAAKNFGATRIALASARMHPTEWLVGEVAGNLAAFCISRDLSDPSVVRDTPDLLAAFQQQLADTGVTLRWSEIIK